MEGEPMDLLYELPLLFAGNGEEGWGPGGGFWLGGPLIILLWIGLTAAVAWLVVRYARPAERSGVDRAREILAERYARGELSSDEYRERLERLQ
jgi:putative membrane protein